MAIKNYYFEYSKSVFSANIIFSWGVEKLSLIAWTHVLIATFGGYPRPKFYTCSESGCCIVIQ